MDKALEAIAKTIVDCAIQVHKALGPGLLESAYQECLAYELKERGLAIECEVILPIIYHGHRIDTGYRIDMIVERAIIIENKVVEHALPIHEAQLFTYLKLSGLHIGFLLNWNVMLMKNGIKRIVYQYEGPISTRNVE